MLMMLSNVWESQLEFFDYAETVAKISTLGN